MEGPVRVKLPGGEFSINLSKIKSNVKKGEGDIKAKDLTKLSDAKRQGQR
ncbi:MAG: hypothetical protein NVSMB60_02140 [Mycobacterium sp.]